MEKGAYLGVIASLATADRQATPEELDYLETLAEAANLSAAQTEAVVKAATDISKDDVRRCLDLLKNSELKYSLITDLIAFAKSDKNYSEEEQQYVHQMASYLGVDEKQFSLLDHFAEKATDPNVKPEQVSSPNFLSSTGLKEKLESAGINSSSLVNGLLAVAGPLLMAKMMSGGRRRRSSFGMGGGMFGGGMGGGMLGGGMGGGLGSLIGMLGGGSMGSMGGLLGGLFGGRRRW